MNLATLPNPVITHAVLLDSFKEMSDMEYEKTLRDLLERGAQFMSRDDTEFTRTLSEDDATLYACACKVFCESFKLLQMHSHDRSVSQIYLAKTISWWQYVSAFRSLCEEAVN